MTITLDPWTSPHPSATSMQLIPIPISTLSALSSYDPKSLEAGIEETWPRIITPYILTRLPLWQRRHAQIQTSPTDHAWITRLILLPTSPTSPPSNSSSIKEKGEEKGIIIGIAGFHAPPNSHGMVEVGYSIDPQYRRRGYGTAALRILIEMARGEGVRVVRATIGPENEVSRGMVVREGFVERGEQWDDVDGREIVWELDLG